MSLKFKRSTILHVEDDPMLAHLARLSLKALGFEGELLPAACVAEALGILETRVREKAPLDLILLDMQLPDGVGLDVLRQVKASPVWYRTPVIFLSGETDPRIIDAAYALGANCYLPKVSPGKGGLVAFKALYECWIEAALTPTVKFTDDGSESLNRGVLFRNRTAKFYLGLASVANVTPEQSFWLERALVEGNMTNLLRFLQEQSCDRPFLPELAVRVVAMQARVEQALADAEKLLAAPSAPEPEEVWRCILHLLEAWDGRVIVEDMAALFPGLPAITSALKARALSQISVLGDVIVDRSASEEFRARARTLVDCYSRALAH